MTAPRIRVLIVDDSAFARKVIRETLTRDPMIEVVGYAREGLEALEMITELEPDVVTMDLMMPDLDGIGVLNVLKQMDRPPRVLVVTTQDGDTKAAIAALQEGAFDVLVKPTALAVDRLYEMGGELIAKVHLAAEGLDVRRGSNAIPVVVAPARAPPSPARAQLLVVGASTGGPRAITTLLKGLPHDLPVPGAVVVHMPEGYTTAFAERLDRELPFHVFEAYEGAPLAAGQVAIARAGSHLVVRRKDGACTLSLSLEPANALHRPSVDALFVSAASAFGANVLAVVLTGMGRDGVEGARALRSAGARVLVESSETAVVFGMPRAVLEAGLANAQVPLHGMAAAVVAHLVHVAPAARA